MSFLPSPLRLLLGIALMTSYTVFFPGPSFSAERPTNHLRGQPCLVCDEIGSRTTGCLTEENYSYRAARIQLLPAAGGIPLDALLLVLLGLLYGLWQLRHTSQQDRRRGHSSQNGALNTHA